MQRNLLSYCSLNRFSTIYTGPTTSSRLLLLPILHPILLSVETTSRSEPLLASSTAAERSLLLLDSLLLALSNPHLAGARSGFSSWDAPSLVPPLWERRSMMNSSPPLRNTVKWKRTLLSNQLNSLSKGSSLKFCHAFDLHLSTAGSVR